mmetsp:Transcript_37650/g.106975  ORF Transcript_37650/g.106975 Transcript_37650/m.106975 type:complete len:288 (+) Transcript_37650:463-1326(+)
MQRGERKAWAAAPGSERAPSLGRESKDKFPGRATVLRVCTSATDSAASAQPDSPGVKVGADDSCCTAERLCDGVCSEDVVAPTVSLVCDLGDRATSSVSPLACLNSRRMSQTSSLRRSSRFWDAASSRTHLFPSSLTAVASCRSRASSSTTHLAPWSSTSARLASSSDRMADIAAFDSSSRFWAACSSPMSRGTSWSRPRRCWIDSSWNCSLACRRASSSGDEHSFRLACALASSARSSLSSSAVGRSRSSALLCASSARSSASTCNCPESCPTSWSMLRRRWMDSS